MSRLIRSRLQQIANRDQFSGARNVTNDLAIGLRVSIETAEKVKLSLSKANKSKDQTAKSDVIEVTDTETKETKK